MKHRILRGGKHLLIFVVSVLVLSLFVFYLSRLTPADPLQAYYGERLEKMSVTEKEQARERLGLNAPIAVQYLRWLKNALQGDFGISYKYKQDAAEVISLRIGNTLLLGGIGFVLTCVGALALGLLCARFEGSLLDRLLCKLGTLLSCIPEFWLSLLLIFVFSVGLRWLPSSGAYCAGQDGNPVDRAVHLILPLTVVLLGHLWYYAYMLRNRLLEEARAEYVLLSRVKGLTKREVLLRHCLRNALPSYISLMAVSVPHVLGGTYIIETVFGYPGIGTLSYESARCADYNLLMLLCMISGALVIACSMLGRILNEHIDPRFRAAEPSEVHAP